MALIAVVCRDEEERRELTLAVEELGHGAAWAADAAGAVELLRERRPQALVAVESPASGAAEALLGLIEREAPLVPALVALKPRSAARAVELMKAGAFEVVAQPWSAENLAPCLSKALRPSGTALEVIKPRPKWRRRASWAFLILLGAGWLWLDRALERRAASSRAAAEPREWTLPYAHPAGLAYDGRELWIPDWYGQTLYRHERATMRVLSASPLPKDPPSALAFAEGALWTSSGRALVKRMLDGRLRPLARVADGLGPTAALAYDGLYLWTADASGRALHKRLPDSELSAVASYPYPGSRAAALAYDGKTLWSLDAGNKELVRHDLSDPRRATLRVALPEYASGRYKPVGLAFDGKVFLSVAEPVEPGAGGRVFAHRVLVSAASLR